MPYWRREPDYWLQSSYLDPEAKKHRFNSCGNENLPIAEVCNGRGSCEPFANTGLSFCRCESGYGGLECEHRRLSQMKAWILCLFLGPTGADQYYLGWYLEMLATQIVSLLALILLLAMPNSRLPGLVLLLGPWMRHVVIIGSAPAQAVEDRTSADLPRCGFVAFSILRRVEIWVIFEAFRLVFVYF